MSTPLEVQALARTVNEILLLSTIRAGPRHGYQIALEIEEGSGGYFSFKHGTLYPILHHLEKEGWIDGTWGSGQVPRRRKEYRLTAGGAEYLEQRLGEWGELERRLADFVAGREAIRARAAAGER